MNLRLHVAQTITPVLRQQTSLSSTFATAIEQLSDNEKPLFHELCFGCLRQFHQLNVISEHLLQKPLRGKDSDVFALVLLGLYQLKHMRIPEHASISETVSAAKKLRKKPWASGLINGVLRSYVREKEAIENKLAKSKRYQFAHPDWLIGRIKKAWPHAWENILLANNQRAQITLRINQQKCTRAEYLALLKNAEINATACEFANHGIRLSSSVDVAALPHFADGYVSVQDEAAQLAAQLLELAPNQRVLDACCAPGGKTCHILETEPQLQHLLAVDLEAARMVRVAENLERLHLQAEQKVADIGNLDDWWDGQAFDRILFDAPCSATGVIRRHPDIKLLRRDDDITNLASLQKQLLDKLWSTLAPGGVLVYATCSVLPDENEHVITDFLTKHTDATLDNLNVLWGQECSAGRQLFPNPVANDGFYYARLRKALLL